MSAENLWTVAAVAIAVVLVVMVARVLMGYENHGKWEHMAKAPKVPKAHDCDRPDGMTFWHAVEGSTWRCHRCGTLWVVMDDPEQTGDKTWELADDPDRPNEG